MEGLDADRAAIEASKNDLRARLTGADVGADTIEQMGFLIDRARTRRDLDKISQTLAPFEPSPVGSATPAENASLAPAPDSVSATDESAEIDRLQRAAVEQLSKTEDRFFEFHPARLNDMVSRLDQARTVAELQRVGEEINHTVEPVVARDPARPYTPEELQRVRANLNEWMIKNDLPIGFIPWEREEWQKLHNEVENARSPLDFQSIDKEVGVRIQRRHEQEGAARRAPSQDPNEGAPAGESAEQKATQPAAAASPEANVANQGPYTLYADDDYNMAYWAGGRLHPLDDDDLEERARRDREPGTPLQGKLPPLGLMTRVSSFDEVEQKEADIAAEAAAQAAAGAATLPPGPAPLAGPPGGIPPAGLRDLEEGRLGWEGRYFAQSGNRWERFDIGRYGNIPILSMDQIKNDQLHQKLIGDLMASMDYRRSGIFDRMQNSTTLSADDQKFLTYAQYELSRIVHTFSPLERSFTDAKVREILVTDPDLMRMMEDTGLAANGKAVREFMMHLAVRHQGSADNFLDAYDKWTDEASVNEAFVAEEEIQAICDEIGILRENYERFVVPGDIETTHAHLTSHFSQNAQAWQRWVDQLDASGYLHLTGSPSDVAAHFAERAMAASPDRYDPSIQETWILGDVHQAKLEMARFFKMGLAPEFQEEMRRYTLNRGAQTEAEANARALAQLELPTLQRLFNVDREQLAAARGFASWNDAPPDVREEIRDQWNPPEVREDLKNRNRSWFSRMMRAIARSLLSEKKRGLDLQNA